MEKYARTREEAIKSSNADITKEKTLVGYNSKYSFERGIKETIEWYKNNI